MWCYSLRFPRIRKVKMNQSFLNCITFQDLQQLGRDSISNPTIPTKTTPIDESYSSKPAQKRVRFVFEEDTERDENLMKTDFYVHLSKKIKLSEREMLTEWLEYRGFELIWSLEALRIYGTARKVIYIYGDDDHIDEFKYKIHYRSVMKSIRVQGSYFGIDDQGIKS